MFEADFLFVTVILIILVSISFWLKVPKAAIPLAIIYAIFILNSIDFVKKYPESIHNKDIKNHISMDDTTIISSRIQYKNQSKQNIQHNDLVLSKPDIEPQIKSKIINQRQDKVDTLPNIIKEDSYTESRRNLVRPKKNKDKQIKKNESVSLLKVKDIKICKFIKKRTPVGSDVIFTNNVDSLYCYTRIQNTGTKKEVKHIWYYKNQIMTQVRYNVRKSNIYRSWTKKTILPNQVGQWRVDVLDNNGTIIGSKKFEIKKVSDYN